MPWLSRRNSDEMMGMSMGMGMMGMGTKSMNYSPMPLSSSSSVTFIPAMMDGSCGTSPTMQRMSSMQMMMMDIKTMIQNMMCIPEMMGSMMTMDSLMEMMGSWTHLRDMCLQMVLCCMEMCMLAMIVPCFMMMPGMAFMCMCIMSMCAIMMMCWPMNGEQVMRCAARGQQLDQYADERWVYINGAMTSHSMMRSQMIQMSQIFCRQMTGIHNRTTGIVMDMMCMMLSNMIPMMYRSTSTMMYAHLRECLLDPAVRKVIVMGNGTGCSILSMAIDRLHADLPIDVMGKLEIYTFGSAASHMSNPCLTLNSPMNPNPPFTRADGSLVSPVKVALAKNGNRMEDTERVIPHMEHYAMTSDFFARCGIMHHTRSMLDNTMCGREFIINSMPMMSSAMSMMMPMRSGFMMNQYIEMLFPMHSSKVEILDEKVCVDMQTAEKREFTAQGMSMLKPMGLGRRSPSSNMMNMMSSQMGEMGRNMNKMDMSKSEMANMIKPEMAAMGMSKADMAKMEKGEMPMSMNKADGTPMTKAEKRASWGNPMIINNDSVAAMRKCAKECEGKTMRQLSRLWMYAGGARPVGEGVGMMNGVGLGLNGIM